MVTPLFLLHSPRAIMVERSKIIIMINISTSNIITLKSEHLKQNRHKKNPPNPQNKQKKISRALSYLGLKDFQKTQKCLP